MGRVSSFWVASALVGGIACSSSPSDDAPAPAPSAQDVDVGSPDLPGSESDGSSSALDGAADVVAPAIPTIAATTPASGASSVAWSQVIVIDFTEPMDQAATTSAFTIAPAVSCTNAWSTPTRVVCDHAPFAAATKYTVSVGTGARSIAGATLAAPYVFSFDTAAIPPPAITAVTIADRAPSLQARMGAGVVTMTVTGSRLDEVTKATVGTLSTIIEPGATSTSLTLKITVPHAVPIGLRDLVITSANGSFTRPNALEVTNITASPSGSDSSHGTPQSPFRTLKQSLLAASEDDHVDLLEGTYDDAHGEVWPSTGTQGNVPAGVAIVGHGAGATLSTTSAMTVGLLFVADGSAENVSLNGFYEGAVAKTRRTPFQSVSLYKVRMSGVGDGLHVLPTGFAYLANSELAGGSRSGIFAEGFARVASPTDIHDFATGIYAFTSSVLEIQSGLGNHVRIHDNGLTWDTPQASGIFAIGGSSITMTGGGIVDHNRNDGMYFITSNAVKVWGVKATDNGKAGIRIEGSGSIDVQSSTFAKNLIGVHWSDGNPTIGIVSSTVDGNSNGVYVTGKSSAGAGTDATMTIIGTKIENNIYFGAKLGATPRNVTFNGVTFSVNGFHHLEAYTTFGRAFVKGSTFDGAAQPTVDVFGPYDANGIYAASGAGIDFTP